MDTGLVAAPHTVPAEPGTAAATPGRLVLAAGTDTLARTVDKSPDTAHNIVNLAAAAADKAIAMVLSSDCPRQMFPPLQP